MNEILGLKTNFGWGKKCVSKNFGPEKKFVLENLESEKISKENSGVKKILGLTKNWAWKNTLGSNNFLVQKKFWVAKKFLVCKKIGVLRTLVQEHEDYLIIYGLPLTNNVAHIWRSR